MKTVESKADLLFMQSPEKGYANSLSIIETVGRTCYKSEDKITAQSAIPFVESLINRGHYAMLEHIPITLKVDSREVWRSLNELHTTYKVDDLCPFRTHLEFIQFNCKGTEHFLIHGSVRSFNDSPILACVGSTIFCEVHPLFAYKFKSIPENEVLEWGKIKGISVLSGEEFSTFPAQIKDRITYSTFRFVTDRGISHELVRHRNCAFAQESTRYCNYSKGNFGHEIACIKPSQIVTSKEYEIWERSCVLAENTYFELLSLGCTPQTARSVLPTSLATTIVVTASIQEWKHIFDLRLFGTTGAPHPDMRVLAEKAYPLLKGKEPMLI